MRSLILIASYLWKDTWSRWREQPGSPLARWLVAGLLVAVATVILVAFAMLERNLRERLESFGLNTLVVRETLSPSDPEFAVRDSRATAWPPCPRRASARGCASCSSAPRPNGRTT